MFEVPGFKRSLVARCNIT